MPLNKNYLTSLISGISLGFILLVLITVSAQAQPYILEVKIGDTALSGYNRTYEFQCISRISLTQSERLIFALTLIDRIWSA